MGANLSSKLTLDGTQHNQSLRDAVKEVSKYKREVDSANKQLNTFQKGMSSATGSISSMMSAFKSGDIGGFITGARGAATAISSMIPAAGGATGAVTGLGAAINTALGPIGWIAAAVAGVVAVVGSAISSVEDFNKSLKGLSALTGVGGDTLKQIGDDAVDLSMKYGTAATEIVDSMKMIGSQAPQLLSDMEGLKGVTEAAMVLQKAADGMTVEDTAKAITTVMNQMNVAASESTNIINTLAAGAQKGAADVNYLSTAIEKTGTSASNAGMTYQQLVGAVETLAPKFSSAEVAGTALNTLLVRLSTQANNNFNPSVVGLEQALENLDKANLSAADKVKLFGQAGLAAADTLIKNREALHDMTEAVSGTNTAYDQMATKSGSLESGWNKVKTTWDALMISLGQSAPIKAIIALLQVIMNILQRWIATAKKVIDAWNTLVEVVGALVRKLWNDYIKPYWDAIVNAVTNSAIYKTAAKIWNAIKDAAARAIRFITNLWNDFLSWLGISSKKAQVVVKPEVDTSEIDNVPGLADPKTGKTKVGKGKTGKTGSSGSSSKVKIDYDTGSLEYYRAELQKLEKKLTSKKLTLVDVEKTKKDIQELKDTIEKEEIRLGIKPKEGSLSYIESEISELDAKIKALNPTIDAVEITDLQIKKEALEATKKEVEAALNIVTVEGSKFKSKGFEGSAQYAADKVSYYKQKLSIEIAGTENYSYWEKKLKEWTEKEREIKLRLQIDTSGAEEGSLSYLNANVSYYKAQLDLYAHGTPEYEEALKNLKEWTKKAQEIKVLIDLDTSDAKEGSLKYIQDRIATIKQKIQLEVYGSDEYKRLRDELEAWEKAEHKIQFKIDVDDMSFSEKFEQFNSFISSVDGVANAVDELADKFKEGANEWEKFVGIMGVVSSSLQTVEQFMTTLNMITKLLGISTQTTSAIEQAASTQRIASVTAETSALATKTATESGEAIAGATSSGASMPFPYNLIAIAMGVAAVIAALASIGKFAGGGIIRGKTTMGDYNLARVNGGEMILNSRQQNNLFKAIDSGNLGSNSNELSAKIKIQGSDMYLLLKNYSKEKSRLGKNIGIH